VNKISHVAVSPHNTLSIPEATEIEAFSCIGAPPKQLPKSTLLAVGEQLPTAQQPW